MYFDDPIEKKRSRPFGHTQGIDGPEKKRACLADASSEPQLSLSSFFYDATAEANEKMRLQEKHAGKVRQFEHVKGRA
jgi:hypothetical protein